MGGARARSAGLLASALTPPCGLQSPVTGKGKPVRTLGSARSPAAGRPRPSWCLPMTPPCPHGPARSLLCRCYRAQGLCLVSSRLSPRCLGHSLAHRRCSVRFCGATTREQVGHCDGSASTPFRLSVCAPCVLRTRETLLQGRPSQAQRERERARRMDQQRKHPAPELTASVFMLKP